MRRIFRTNRFKKDVKRIKKREFDTNKLKNVISMLAKHKQLDHNRYRPHKLLGKYEDFWECHIENDWLLIWYIDNEDNLILVRTGTHSDLFE